jgi:hypothetical protein
MDSKPVKILPIEDVIPETNIVVFSPHYDDFLLGIGGYSLELKARNFLKTKNFHILLVFSRSNYQAGSGSGNYDTSLERIKLATGNRILEDMDCLDEILGEHRYHYQLLGERECLLRAKTLAENGLEFPHGTYPDFNEEDWQVFHRLQKEIESWSIFKDTALVFPLAIREHIDHFILREAAITTARKLGSHVRVRFYFQEDKPYAGLQSQAEEARIEQFVRANDLKAVFYPNHADQVIELAFKHYTSQVEPIYRQGIQQRSEQLMRTYQLTEDCDRIFRL